MNFFFGFSNNDFFTELTIPKFQNSGLIKKNLSVFSANIIRNYWSISKVNSKESNSFFYLDRDIVNSSSIFFLATQNDLNKFLKTNYLELLGLNNFTNTTPEYRANFKIYNDIGGYSSYQSDYPFSMTKINGSILSSTFLLTNKHADKNYLLLRNIYYKPIIDDFEILVVNITSKKILLKKNVKTNTTNLIELTPDLIQKDCYIVSKKYVAIPIFITVKDGHISMEHTLPPSSYLMTSDRYKKAKKLKELINEIIN